MTFEIPTTVEGWQEQASRVIAEGGLDTYAKWLSAETFYPDTPARRAGWERAWHLETVARSSKAGKMGALPADSDERSYVVAAIRSGLLPVLKPLEAVAWLWFLSWAPLRKNRVVQASARHLGRELGCYYTMAGRAMKRLTALGLIEPRKLGLWRGGDKESDGTTWFVPRVTEEKIRKVMAGLARDVS